MRLSDPRVSIVIPARNEGENIVAVLDRVFESVRLPCEVLVVVDTDDDTTIPVVGEYAEKEARVQPVVSTYGSGPANAIAFGPRLNAGQLRALTYRRSQRRSDASLAAR